MAHESPHEKTDALDEQSLRTLSDDETPAAPSPLTRRAFVERSVGAAACAYLATLNTGCGDDGGATRVPRYPIDSTVATTAERTLSFSIPPKISQPGSGTGLCPTELPLVTQYRKYGYGTYAYGAGLPVEQRFDLMPAGYRNPTPVRLQRIAHFFAMTDIHITDKESPNQLIYLQQADPVYGAPGTSIYSPIMLYTTHVLDAAVQTINALHARSSVDFVISLGDACNSTQFNELRWYIDVIDGKLITPSSGAHLGEGTIDYQRPYRAAGLDEAIPWYQTLGNHDRFWLGSVAVDADPTIGIREAYVAGTVWAVGDVLSPNTGLFPCTHDSTTALKTRSFYMGVIDGSTATGDIRGAGPVASFAAPPSVVADPDRRALLRTEWIEEFFDTTTHPVGHGFNLVDPSMGADFACYSFRPKSNVPLKVIVLDDTQSETDGSHDIHGHGFLDARRWDWLRAELEAGQANDQLMIIAAHVPIAVASIGSAMEWWQSDKDPNTTEQNAVSLAELVSALQSAPNLLMWIAGHRHLNTVKAFLPPAGAGAEHGFWQVETSSLHDFPQQLREFEIYVNSDYSISIVTTNVDPAVRPGTPAATSREYAIAAQQIVQTNLTPNNPNLETAFGSIPVEAMDPTRPQGDTSFTDPTIRYGSTPDMPNCASYNAELFKQLSARMIEALKATLPNASR